ncbi:hypothetical protein F5Y15DRAFT_135480 [Xylariaceae sp. FL0016]|nr:hypothetical protein F5Y15DRAFT_135480 [Xylariaceae sp. FL0016]
MIKIFSRWTPKRSTYDPTLSFNTIYSATVYVQDNCRIPMISLRRTSRFAATTLLHPRFIVPGGAIVNPRSLSSPRLYLRLPPNRFTAFSSCTTTTSPATMSASEPSATATASAAPPCPADSSSPSPQDVKPSLPPLSPAEFRGYNRLADHMDLFHAHFRQTWNLLYTAASTGQRPPNTSLKSFITEGLSFISHLETHHTIEETYIFPVLARKMPEFQAGGKGKGKDAAELLRQHKEIHKGMEGLEEYLTKCRTGETALEMSVLKEQMDTWGTVLWTHLDQEVATLGAENMRKYWTIDEIRRIPM